MPRNVEVRFERTAIIRLTSQVSNEVAYNMARKTKSRLRRLVPVDTGALRESFIITPVYRMPDKTKYMIWTPLDYAQYQDQGTGPIHARPGGVLRFKPKGSQVFIFRPRTKGVPAQHFFARAIAEITVMDAK